MGRGEELPGLQGAGSGRRPAGAVFCPSASRARQWRNESRLRKRLAAVRDMAPEGREREVKPDLGCEAPGPCHPREWET